MNVAPLTITQEEAEAALREYEKQLAEERTEEDRAIAQAYRAAARGLQVIRLSEAFRIAGRFDGAGFVQGERKPGLPKLAIVRADATRCWVRGDNQRDWVFRSELGADNRGALVGKHTVRVPGINDPYCWQGGSTTVPIIPPRHRPSRWRMRGFHILWEVEAWDPTPPRDPALLRHIRGDLWSVLATWDLTDVERAVLSQRSG